MLGAYFLLFRHARVLVLFPIVFIPLFFEIPAIVFLIIWFGLQLIEAWRALGGGGGGVGEVINIGTAESLSVDEIAHHGSLVLVEFSVEIAVERLAVDCRVCGNDLKCRSVGG